MTTTTTPETPSGNERQAHNCDPRGCGPRGGGPRFAGAYGGPFAGPSFGPFGPQLAARFGPGGWQRVPVNIEDATDAYILSLYAAGLDKSGIRVSVQGDVLSIRYAPAQDEDSTRTFTRRELPHRGFEREFALNGKVALDAITASYTDGVLTVRLPKTPDAQRPEQQVPVQ